MKLRAKSFRGSLKCVLLVLGAVGVAWPAAASANGLVPAPTVAVPSVATLPSAKPRKKAAKPRVGVSVGTRSLAATSRCNSTQAGEALNCVNFPLAGEVLNECNGFEPVTIAGTFRVETKFTFNPLTSTFVLYQRSNFQNVTGFATATPTRKYQANDTNYTETTEFPLPVGTIDLYRSDRTELISNDLTPNFLLHQVVRTQVDPLTLTVDVNVTGPGVKCTA